MAISSGATLWAAAKHCVCIRACTVAVALCRSKYCSRIVRRIPPIERVNAGDQNRHLV